jgi:hypothetical protein
VLGIFFWAGCSRRRGLETVDGLDGNAEVQELEERRKGEERVVFVAFRILTAWHFFYRVG